MQSAEVDYYDDDDFDPDTAMDTAFSFLLVAGAFVIFLCSLPQIAISAVIGGLITAFGGQDK